MLSFRVPSLVQLRHPTASVAALHAVSLSVLWNKQETGGQQHRIIQLPLVMGAALRWKALKLSGCSQTPSHSLVEAEPVRKGPPLRAVFPVVPQGLSARLQFWTGPVSLQCLCSLG